MAGAGGDGGGGGGGGRTGGMVAASAASPALGGAAAAWRAAIRRSPTVAVEVARAKRVELHVAGTHVALVPSEARRLAASLMAAVRAQARLPV